ncbi:hypothetical protein L1987_72028 [Smallanthus sonchifolius]|uniref:Uncharacterized protein n=1 Tax=Smallanthus sonchifolius TaxID=185202 RepID=A0ACB9AU40_9ASTR|nr:hypothetical protein L1987_72028 [Smallanthus sonchifolius]
MEKLSMLTFFLLVTFMATGNEMMRVNAFQCIEERQVFTCDGCNLVCQVAHFRTAATVCNKQHQDTSKPKHFETFDQRHG